MLSVLIIAHAQDAYAGAGHGEPVILDLGDRQVGIDTQLSPLDITLGNFNDVTMSIKFYDAETSETFDNVTYFVEIWHAKELLARELFFDFDGNLDVKIKPDGNCSEPQQFKCTKYYGAREPITGALYDLAGTPVVQGPVMTEGGVYTLEVEVVGASGMTAQLTEPVRVQVQFSAPQEQQFVIQNAGNDFPIVLKTYYDTVANFRFDEAQKSMSFDMPFDWQPSVIEHTGLIHEEIRIPKYFEAYADNTSFQGYVDGIELSEKSVILDPYSSAEYNIIHMSVTNSDLRDINEKIGQEHHDRQTISFELFPKGPMYGNSATVVLDTGAKVGVSMMKQDAVQPTTPVKFTFFGENGQLLKNVRYGYEITTGDGSIIVTDTGLGDQGRFGIFAPDGIDVRDVSLPGDEALWIKLVLLEHATGSPAGPVYDNGIGRGMITGGDDPGQPGPQAPPEIPSWIKNNAKWWADGDIGDDAFVGGIQYMIKEGIIQIPSARQGAGVFDGEIPSWIKNNAAWWSEGRIADSDFVSGIRYMVENNIISLQ